MYSDSDSASHWEYVDFDLEIGEQRESRRYPVSVRSPEGEAKEEMRFPFDEWELKDKLRDVEFALLRSGGSRRRIGTPEEQTIQAFGRALFEAVLIGEVATHYRVSWREARRQNKGLRVKLHVRPPELSSLPWEFVYDPQRSYLGLSSRTPLVRYPDVPHPIERLTVTPPLRILGMVASPLGLPQLDVGHEKRLVEEALRGLQARRLVELTWLEGQTWRDLQRGMRRGPWHVFHFIGHGGFDPETEEGAIALSDEEGRKHLLGASDLALLLDDHYFLRLVFLNSCEGARGSPRDAFSSTSATLVHSGIPAVVAMQYEITDRAAIEFSRSFYDAVADRLPIDAAVAEARTAVKMGSALEWGTPVLYMRSEDGLIFDISAETRKPQRAQEKTEEREGEDSLRRYRERVVWAWVDGALHERDTQRLKDFRSEVGLNASIAARVEREVMGETIEGVLERQEQAAREKERKERLDGLYARARRSYRDRQWQAVVDVFAQIHSEDPAYPDPERLFISARQALDIAEKEQNAHHEYREAVQSAWADEELDRHEVETLRVLADKLEVSPRDIARIDREIMGDTKEAIVESQERAAKDQYRRAVGEVWIENKVDDAEADRLGALRSELDLSTNTAADIEREVTGDTVQAILQRQTRQEEERQRRLDELYAQARQLHGNGQWQAVVNVFEQIHAVEPGYPDPEGLLETAHEALERLLYVSALYDQGRQHMDAREWQQALECFEEVERLESGYRDIEMLLSGVRHELALPPPVDVPDLVGKSFDEAQNMLHAAGLRLSMVLKTWSDNVPKDKIVKQNPAAGSKVEQSSFLHITVSSGPQEATATVPSGKRATQVREAVSLSSGNQAFFDELTRVCAKYTGLGYYVNEAISEQNLADARSSIPIPTGERVIALVDNSSMLARGIGLAVCGDGIRWRNYAENPVSRNIQGFLEWPEFADVPLREHRWASEYGIEMGPDNVFVAWKDNTMDQHRLVKLLLDIQSLVKSSFSH